jgi:uncharacterized protein YuzE
VQDALVTAQQLANGIVVEYDSQGRLVGLEILDATEHLGEPSIFQQIILEGVGLSALLRKTGSKP